jgi:hypothetical protein
MPDFYYFLLPFNFVLLVEVLCDPHKTDLPFLKKPVNVVTSLLRIFLSALTNCSGCSPRCFRKTGHAAIWS